jgi:CubicO group peptidase (beta-lactamase class C family)
MRDSSYEQPLPPALASRAARAHDGEGKSTGVSWHVYPEQAAAGLRTTPGDLARFIIEVQKAVRGPKGAVLTQAAATAMVCPVSVGPFGVGLSIDKRGEGWYFSHGGSSWGFRGGILGHVRKGYGVAILTNGDNGSALIQRNRSARRRGVQVGLARQTTAAIVRTVCANLPARPPRDTIAADAGKP